MSGRRSSRRTPLLAALAAVLVALSPAAAGAASWEPFPLPPPPGGQFSTPVGYPGDLKFWSANRGLMTVDGNNSVPKGIYSWNGRDWHQLATVCGGTAGRAKIAWAGPREFWTLAEPSPGVTGVFGAMCHFQDGAVVGSYARTNVPDHTSPLNAAACRAPDDCWFGGPYGEHEDGTRVGAFHLRWDGRELRAVYGPQGRAVSDLEAHGGQLFESVFMGPTFREASAPLLRVPEDPPALVHRIQAGAFANDPWAPAASGAIPAGGTELHALDGVGTTLWAVGGGARSGPAAASGPVERLPLAARLDGDQWVELDVRGADLREDEVFSDVAAIPGTQAAWATLTRSETTQTPVGTDEQPRVAHIAPDGQTTVVQLAGPSDPIRGAAVRIDCPATDDCWLVTARGFLYRWGGPKLYPLDDDPAFQGTISERPNEGAAQFVPDTPPEDDSRLFAPPVEVPQEPPAPPAQCGQPPRLLARVRRPLRTLVPGQRRQATNPRYRLTVPFRLSRPARVALIAERRVRGGNGGATQRRGRTRVVARTRASTLRPGWRRLTVVVRSASWPTRLRFALREVRRPRCVDAGNGPTAQTTAVTR